MDHPKPSAVERYLPLGLALLVLLVFARVATCGFTNYDDNSYITDNPHLRDGLSQAGISWAATQKVMDLWHPVTLLSLQLDYELFGLNPAGYHVENAILHAVNAALLYLLLKRMTGDSWRAVLVAALWAVHPLRVESVAWVVERKDVLSLLFILLALLAYVHMAAKFSWQSMLGLYLAFASSLLAKPMYITLPALLLLLDYWPLRRWKTGTRLRLIIEKLPLLAVAIIGAWEHIFSFSKDLMNRLAGHAASIGPANLPSHAGTLQTAGNSVVAYVRYLGKIAWFRNLAVVYPEEQWSIGVVASCALMLLATSIALVMLRRRAPFLFVGWFWFLLVLLPVTNVQQFGPFSMADRYTYMASMGILIAVVWSIPPSWFVEPGRQQALAMGAGGLLAVMSAATFVQIGYWQNTFTLYSHAIDVTRDNYIAHLGIGTAYGQMGDHRSAETHFAAAVAIRPNLAAAHKSLGAALVAQNQNRRAIAEFTAAIRLDQSDGESYVRIMKPLLNENNPNGALAMGTEAQKRGENSAMLHTYLGAAHAALGNMRAAEAEYRAALAIDPSRREALAFLFHFQGSGSP